jgi:hypothetical protein
VENYFFRDYLTHPISGEKKEIIPFNSKATLMGYSKRDFSVYSQRTVSPSNEVQKIYVWYYHMLVDIPHLPTYFSLESQYFAILIPHEKAAKQSKSPLSLGDLLCSTT